MSKKKKPVRADAFKPIKKIVIFSSFALTLITLGILFFVYGGEDLGPQLPPPPANAIYRQADQPIDERVQDLLSYMTLEEKIGQMSLVDKNSLIKLEDISRYSLGAVLSGAGAKPDINTAVGWANLAESYKTQAMQSRLQIPILYGVDANHGHANVPGATVFPHAIGLGASNDPDLVEKIAFVTSEELLATGINWNYSPSLDAPKDIRWGRVYEAYSDDPETISRLGSAYITGTQRMESGVLASAKHFLGTGSMRWGSSEHKTYQIDHGIIPESENALRRYYLPPYKAAVDADVASIMTALTRFGDSRVVDNKYLLTDVLKGELNFQGFVVSDWYGTYEYANTGDYSANVKTINAGLDMAMLPFEYKNFLNDVRLAVDRGDITQERIDDAVSRILKQKFKAGLFDTPIATRLTDAFGSKEHRVLAREAVSSSAVLLKNDAVLPLSKSTDRILVAGSGADNVGRQTGAWTVEWQGIDGNDLPGSTSILKGLKQVAGNDIEIEYDESGNFNQKASVGIVVVSEKPYAEGFGDNPNPILAIEDLQAIENTKKQADKVVVVLLSGRPLLITDQLQNWDGLVAAWLPGSEGAGIADLLFGDTPFTAKLPIAWPATLQQIPMQNNGQTSDDTTLLFERGYGLN